MGVLFKRPDENPTVAELFQKLGGGIVDMAAFWKRKAQTKADLVAPRRYRKVDSLARWIVLDALPWISLFWNRIACAVPWKGSVTFQVPRKTSASSTASPKPGDEHIELEKQDLGQREGDLFQDPRLVSACLG